MDGLTTLGIAAVPVVGVVVRRRAHAAGTVLVVLGALPVVGAVRDWRTAPSAPAVTD